MMTTTPVETITPISGHEVEQLASTEYGRFVDLLVSLDDGGWSSPTDCPDWDVRAVAGHSVAMMGDFTSVRSVLRRVRSATRESQRARGELVDGMTAPQGAHAPHLPPPELMAEAAALAGRTAHWRTTAPGWFRLAPMKADVGGKEETWKMGFLLDTILTRDPWMHRVDIVRATGSAHVLTTEHDGRIIADVVAEWARRHGQPFTLELTGPAGGHYVAGGGSGEHLSVDAVEFCRILSGRAQGSGLLAQAVPF